jgi:serine/threonine protein kinase
MPEGEKQCSCGADMRVRALELSQTWICADCGHSQATSAHYDLGRGQLPPDLTPLRNLARRWISNDETVELDRESGIGDLDTQSLAVNHDDSTETVEGGVLPVDTGPSFLSELRTGIEGLKDRIGRKADVDPATPQEAEQGASSEVASSEVSSGEDEDDDLLPAGQELGNYVVVETLGRGGMGVVYKGKDPSLDRFVAVKVLSRDLSRNRQFIERFDREAKACGKLSHPNITTIYHYKKGDHYFAMEFVDGENLADRLKREGPLPVDVVLDVARQTAEGLKAAASVKIIHRDIKPSNLLLNSSGQVKITDFGLAKAKASIGHTLDLTSTGVVMGTPLYMSPEQAKGGTVDHRSDIYSLGATLFFLLYGCPPFEADSPIAIILKHINDPVAFPDQRRDVPAGVKALLTRMLAKELERRPPDYDTLLADLTKVARGESLNEESPRRVIVLTPKKATGKRSLFKTGKLSVARTNLKLGRRDKAISLLSEAVYDGDPAHRAEAALLLMGIHQDEGDLDKLRAMAEVVATCSSDPSSSAYAAWKLAELDEQEAMADLRRALERYEAILRDPPADLPRTLIEHQVERLRGQLQAAEKESQTTQLRLGGPK